MGSQLSSPFNLIAALISLMIAWGTTVDLAKFRILADFTS
jgi:hypothetical protein